MRNSASQFFQSGSGLRLSTWRFSPRPAYKIHPNRQGAIGQGSFDAVVTQRTKRCENACVEIEVTDDPLANFTLALGTVVQQVNVYGLIKAPSPKSYAYISKASVQIVCKAV